MEPRDLVVIGGSAGSLTPLCQLVAALPHGLPAAVAVTIHISEALGRHLAAQAPPGDDLAEERNDPAAWATNLASAVREHIRNAPGTGAPGADAPS